MPDDTQLNDQLLLLEKELKQQKRYEKISRTLFQVSNAVSLTTEPDQLYKSIHQSLATIIDASNFFIALYHPEDDKLTFPYCVDEVDGYVPRFGQCQQDLLSVCRSSQNRTTDDGDQGSDDQEKSTVGLSLPCLLAV